MSKTFATVFGIAYLALGLIGFFDTSLVGTVGFFAADALYSAVFAVIGIVLLAGAFFATSMTRGINAVLGILLVVIALSGFLVVPDRGEMLGMLVSGSDHWLNLIAGALLAISGIFERSARTDRLVSRPVFRM